MVTELLSLEDRFVFQMVSPAIYGMMPRLPPLSKTEWYRVNQYYDSKRTPRKKLSAACGGCHNLLPLSAFWDKYRGRRRLELTGLKRCISCSVGAIANRQNLNYEGVKSFACNGCRKAQPLVSDSLPCTMSFPMQREFVNLMSPSCQQDEVGEFRRIGISWGSPFGQEMELDWWRDKRCCQACYEIAKEASDQIRRVLIGDEGQ